MILIGATVPCVKPLETLAAASLLLQLEQSQEQFDHRFLLLKAALAFLSTGTHSQAYLPSAQLELAWAELRS